MITVLFFGSLSDMEKPATPETRQTLSEALKALLDHFSQGEEIRALQVFIRRPFGVQ